MGTLKGRGAVAALLQCGVPVARSAAIHSRTRSCSASAGTCFVASRRGGFRGTGFGLLSFSRLVYRVDCIPNRWAGSCIASSVAVIGNCCPHAIEHKHTCYFSHS